MKFRFNRFFGSYLLSAGICMFLGLYVPTIFTVALIFIVFGFKLYLDDVIEERAISVLNDLINKNK